MEIVNDVCAFAFIHSFIHLYRTVMSSAPSRKVLTESQNTTQSEYYSIPIQNTTTEYYSIPLWNTTQYY